MQAIGLIETYGLLPAIECADVMLKTAQVELVERTFVGGGHVTITVMGDVGAVKASVEAGITAIVRFGHSSLISHHVIPRPHSDIATRVFKEPLPNPSTVTVITEPKTTIVESPTTATSELIDVHKEGVDALVREEGLEKSVKALKGLTVVKLRKLVREYKELGIAGRAISKANKDLLIKQLMEYYQRCNNK